MASKEIEDSALHFEAIYTFQKKSKEGVVIHLAIHPDDVPVDLLSAFIGSRFMVAMVQVSDQEEPVPRKGVVEGDKAMGAFTTLCRNDKFHKWLSQSFIEEIETEEAATAWVKGFLGIESRKEIKTSPEVREAFFNLRDEFISDFKSGKIK